MNPFALLLRAIYLAAALLFLTGFVLGASRGTAPLPTRGLLILNLLFLLLLVAGLVLSGGLAVFLMFQYVGLVLVLDIVYVAGACCGAGLHALQHRKQATALDTRALQDYLALEEFAQREGITEERVLVRLRSGFYRGGQHDGRWYVHRSELTDA